jgi:hypothetical protein
MTDPATPAQLNHHLDLLDAHIIACEMFLQQTQGQPSVARTRELRKLFQFKQAHRHFATRLAAKTGNIRVPPSVYVITQEDLDKASNTDKSKDLENKARQDIKDAIDTIQNGLMRFQGAILREVQHAHAWGLNFIISDLCRIGSGQWWRTPFIIRDRTVPQVDAYLKQAREALVNGQLKTALAKVQLAQKWLNWGEMRFNAYCDQIQKGGERVVTGIKITATVATAIVTGGASAGGLAMGVTEGAVLGVAGEGSQQATELIARGIDGGYTVSGEDMFNAVMETAVAGTAGSFGEGGRLVVQALAGKVAARIATRILGRAPTASEIAFVTDRIQSVVSANYSQLVKKAAKLDTDPNWDAWAGIVAPMVGGMSAEVIKEGSMRKPFVNAGKEKLGVGEK